MMENFELPQLASEYCHADIGEVLSSVVSQIDRQQQSGSSELPLTGVSTGFPEIDRLTLGLQVGELVVIAGRPGCGRYVLALKIVEHIAGGLGRPVVFHSLTNTAEEVGLRLLSSASGVDSYRMRTGQLDDSEWQKISTGLATLHSAPLAIESNPRGDFESCSERTRQHAKHFGRPPGLIVVDDFQAFRFAGKHPSLDEARQVALCSLRQLAGELAAPLLILSQLDARIDHRPELKPCLIDLPRSGCIEAKADTILLLSRDYEFEDDQTKGTPRRYGIRIHQAKSRFDYSWQCSIALSDDALPTSLCWGSRSD